MKSDIRFHFIGNKLRKACLFIANTLADSLQLFLSFPFFMTRKLLHKKSNFAINWIVLQCTEVPLFFTILAKDFFSG